MTDIQQITELEKQKVKSVVSKLLSNMGKDMVSLTRVQGLMVMSSLVINLEIYMIELLDEDWSDNQRDWVRAHLKHFFEQITDKTNECMEKLNGTNKLNGEN